MPKSEHSQVQLVTDQLDKAIEYVASEFARWHRRDIAALLVEQETESPIEAVFWIWAQALITLSATVPSGWTNVQLNPQVSVQCGDRSYRLDFTIGPDVDLLFDATKLGLDLPSIAVELDGHEWHERTKNQVVERNRRDRDLQAAGWKVFHFSGTELLKDPVTCVTQVLEFASGAFYAVQRAVRQKQSQA